MLIFSSIFRQPISADLFGSSLLHSSFLPYFVLQPQAFTQESDKQVQVAVTAVAKIGFVLNLIGDVAGFSLLEAKVYFCWMRCDL